MLSSSAHDNAGILISIKDILDTSLIRPLDYIEQTEFSIFFRVTLWYELQAKLNGKHQIAVYSELREVVEDAKVYLTQKVMSFRVGDSGSARENVESLLEEYDSFQNKLPAFAYIRNDFPEDFFKTIDILTSWQNCCNLVQTVQQGLQVSDSTSKTIDNYIVSNGMIAWPSCKLPEWARGLLVKAKMVDLEWRAEWMSRDLPVFDQTIYRLRHSVFSTLIDKSSQKISMIKSQDTWVQIQELLPDLWRLVEAKCEEASRLHDDGYVVQQSLIPTCVKSVAVFIENIVKCARDEYKTSLIPIKALEELEHLWFEAPRIFENMPRVNYDFTVDMINVSTNIVKDVNQLVHDSLIDLSSTSPIAPISINGLMLKIRSHLRFIQENYGLMFQSLLLPSVEAVSSFPMPEVAVSLGGGWKVCGKEIDGERIANMLSRQVHFQDLQALTPFVLFHSSECSMEEATNISEFLDQKVDKSYTYSFGNLQDHVGRRIPLFLGIKNGIGSLHSSILSLGLNLMRLTKRFSAAFRLYGERGCSMNWYAFIVQFVFKALSLSTWKDVDVEMQSTLADVLTDWISLNNSFPICDYRFHRWTITVLNLLRQCLRSGFLQSVSCAKLSLMYTEIKCCIRHLRQFIERWKLEKTRYPTISSITLSQIDKRRDEFGITNRLIGQQIESKDSEQKDHKGLQKLNLQKIAVIGYGSYGQVYEAIDLETGALVAVKEARLQLSSSTIHEKIRAEAEVLKRLSNPNVIEYYGVQIVNHTVSIITEYCSGGSLARHLQLGPIFDDRLLKNYCWQMLQGLSYIHSRSIIHRDIKPENILTDRIGILKLADFGCIGKDMSSVKELVGTPAYMAPEAVIGSLAAKSTLVTTKSDIWSFGCTLLHMVTGKRPWYQLDNELSILFHLGSTDDIPKIPSDEAAHVSPECLQLVKDCIKRRPESRPSAIDIITSHVFLRNPASFKYLY